MKFIKKNLIVILAFTIPVLFIVGVGLMVYIPESRLKTTYDFIYVSCMGNTQPYYGEYGCSRDTTKKGYSVIENKLVEHSDVSDINAEYMVSIFRFDGDREDSEELSYVEAQKLRLDTSLTSPDGIGFVEGYGNNRNNSFSLFGGGNSYGYYLTQGRLQKEIILRQDDRRYSNGEDIRFMGWIIN